MPKTGIERYRIFVSRIVCLGLVILCPFFYNGWDRSGRPGVAFATLLFVLGIALATVGAFGRVWCALYIAGRKNARLVTEGPYSLCRNPLYFFSLVGALGVALTSETLAIPLVTLVFFLLYYPPVIRQENARLAGLFGPDYAAYRLRVPAFLPARRRPVEPTAYTVDARIFRQHLCGAAVFLVAPLGFHLFETLHELGMLPTFFLLF